MKDSTIDRFGAFSFTHYNNDRVQRAGTYGGQAAEIISRESAREAMEEISSWPGYAVTPLVDLPGLAKVAGVGRIAVKHEASRFGLGSFKALGGAYAVRRVLAYKVREATGETPSTRDLLEGRYRDLTRGVTVTTATDGNHGRSVAWGARLFGCESVVYIHAEVSDNRARAIERYGAQVVRTPGIYDEAVRRCAEDAEARGRIVISDTSYQEYMEIPRDVMRGYTVMVEEALNQWGDAAPPTHVFVQGGVGALAAAVCAHLWQSLGERRPRFAVVEPDTAACLYLSAVNGRPTPAKGDLRTIMAGLACGEVSLLAWEILRNGTNDFITIPDEPAMECMRMLAAGVGGDAPMVAGESAVAGLAAALMAAASPERCAALEMDADSRMLVFATEGDTDPDQYRDIVGRSAAEVLGRK